MTDKQIIIDGCDVSRCEFRFRTYGCDCMSSNRETKVLTEGSRCADNHNCYFKQLARKTQECEELKKQIESDKGLITDAGKQNYQLIQEYNRLKAENEELKKKCNIYTCGICGNKEDCNKLYKTLTEIKEIAEYEFKELMNAEDYHNMTEVLKQILQIIDEVE